MLKRILVFLNEPIQLFWNHLVVVDEIDKNILYKRRYVLVVTPFNKLLQGLQKVWTLLYYSRTGLFTNSELLQGPESRLSECLPLLLIDVMPLAVHEIYHRIQI